LPTLGPGIRSGWSALVPGASSGIALPADLARARQQVPGAIKHPVRAPPGRGCSAPSTTAPGASRDIRHARDIPHAITVTVRIWPQLPDDAPAEQIRRALTHGWIGAEARVASQNVAAVAATAPGSYDAAPAASDGYDERWLTPQERAARDAANAGKSSADVAPGSVVREA
jgi:hypothetical protein